MRINRNDFKIVQFIETYKGKLKELAAVKSFTETNLASGSVEG